MLAIPVPFVITLILSAGLIYVLTRGMAQRLGAEMLVLWGMTAAQSAIVAFRWTYDLTFARILLPIMAAALPPLVWLCVDTLRSRGTSRPYRWLPPVIAATFLGGLVLVWREPIDIVLMLIEVVYGVAVLRVGLTRADDLTRVPFGSVAATQRLVLALGIFVLIGATIDAVLAFTVRHGEGDKGAMIVSIGDLVVLFGIAASVFIIAFGRDAAPDIIEEAASSDATEPQTGPAPEDVAILAVVDELLTERGLYRDPDLTLDRLARRAHLPARIVSAAINRTHGVNVSQYVNGFRIAEAQRRLRETDEPVTAILGDVGFQTKSNFNREFRRIAGCSPTEWRTGAEDKLRTA